MLALLLTLAIGVSNVAIDQTRVRSIAAVGQPPPALGGLENLPLIYAAQLTVIGGFRVPTTGIDPSCYFTYSLQGQLAYSSATKLYAHNTVCVSELNIPTLVNSSTPANLNVATFSQSWIDPSEGNIVADMNPQNGYNYGGILLSGSFLYWAAYSYYDAGGNTTKSHGRHHPTLATTGGYAGMDTVWDGAGLPLNTKSAGFVSSYMAHVPAQWQASLGGQAIAGGQCMPIVSRTSNGPAAFSFNPADINVAAEPVVAYPLVYGDLDPYNGATARWGGTACIGGVAIIKDTRTMIVVGRNGTGTFCYGGVPPCVDPESSDSGNHAAPYSYQFWFYDLLDLAAAKAGTKNPTTVVPYSYTTFTFPVTGATKIYIHGVTYDEVNQTLYIGQARCEPTAGDRQFPCIWAFAIDVTP